MFNKIGLFVDLVSAICLMSFVGYNVDLKPVNFTEVQKVSDRVPEKSVYADIINYATNPTLDIRNRMTCAHETTHMINSYLRNKEGGKTNAFYLPPGWAFIVKEPNIRKSQVAQYIPSNVRGYRYSTYVTGAREWDDTPLYLIDEWSAYINGAMVGIDDVNNNRHNGEWTDGVSGCLELSLYCVALCMAIEQHDNTYWTTNEQFRNFMKWNLQRAYNTYEIGKDYKEFKWNKQEEFLQRFRTSAETKSMRDFITKYFDGIGLE